MVTLPSPATEARLSPSKRPSNQGDGSEHFRARAATAGHDSSWGLSSGGGGGNDGSSGGISRTDDRQRFKSLLTNAPAPLPEVKDGIATKKNGIRVSPDFGGMENESASAGSAGSAGLTGSHGVSAPQSLRQGLRGEGSDSRVDSPTPYRRAMTAKVNYHNTLMRRSLNTTFTHPVGHSDSLVDALFSRSDPLEGWGEEKETSFQQPRSAVVAAQKARENIANRGATEQGRWVPGAQSKGAVEVEGSSNTHSMAAGHPQQTTCSPAQRKDKLDERDAPTKQQLASEISLASNITHRDGTGGSGNGGRSNGWGKRSLHKTSSKTPVDTEFSRQLAVAGGLQGQAGGHGGVHGFMGQAIPRLQGRTNRHVAGRGADSGVDGAESNNNLHPAWRPKGLTRRQRAVSVVEMW